MVGKIGDKKVTGVTGPRETSEVDRAAEVERALGVDRAGAVDRVDEVKAARGVGGVRGVGTVQGKRRATRTMTAAEREALLSMIHEEAEKFFKDTRLSPERRKIAEDAVMMAVDSGILVEEKENDEQE